VHALERRSVLCAPAAGASGSSSSPDASYPAARDAAGPWSPSSSPPVAPHPHAPHELLVAHAHFEAPRVRCPPCALAAPCPQPTRTPCISPRGSVLARPATLSWLARFDRSPIVTRGLVVRRSGLRHRRNSSAGRFKTPHARSRR
jgi:hypothetical protein